jgi:hypothetical protein
MTPIDSLESTAPAPAPATAPAPSSRSKLAPDQHHCHLHFDPTDPPQMTSGLARLLLRHTAFSTSLHFDFTSLQFPAFILISAWTFYSHFRRAVFSSEDSVFSLAFFWGASVMRANATFIASPHVFLIPVLSPTNPSDVFRSQHSLPCQSCSTELLY